MEPLQQPRSPAAPRLWWRRLWPQDRRRQARRAAAHGLYRAVVNQARSPVLFRDLGVPDTPEGRFEMVALHASLALRRLRREGDEGRAIGQELFDLMFADMDASLRELGVGDLSVGRYVKRLAGNFYARLAALDEGLANPGPTAFERLLTTNVYRGGPVPDADQLRRLAAYLVGLDHALASQPSAALLGGAISFAPAGAASAGGGR